jgi:large subunit ribosomal protein L17
MRHANKGRKFGRDTNERKALFRNLVKSLITFEQIKTTLPKAKDLRPIVEKMITKGREESLHVRRQLMSELGDVTLVQKVMTTLKDRYAQRPGGYLRIIKAGTRKGDNAPMAYIEFVDRDPAAKPKTVPVADDAAPAA